MTVVETYLNRFTCPPNQECVRYTVHPFIVVGGNVNNHEDYYHLHWDLHVAGFINLDHNHVSPGEGYDCLWFPVQDDGKGFDPEDVRRVVSHAYKFKGQLIYISCHIGFSRSPSFAYAIMRWVYGMSGEEAMGALNSAGGPYGSDYLMCVPKHLVYIDSIERAFRT